MQRPCGEKEYGNFWDGEKASVPIVIRHLGGVGDGAQEEIGACRDL